MKKIITFILALIVCATSAVAEFDLTGMTLEELIQLQQQVQLAMWVTDDWQEVEVPVGIYEIGVDIPAGKWTMTSTDISSLTYGKRTNEFFTDVDDLIEYESFYSSDESITWNLVEGTFLQISSNPFVFTPYTAPKLGFK